MDFISSNTHKPQLQLSMQNEARSEFNTLLGESYRAKLLWIKGDTSFSYITNVVIKNGYIYYQTQKDPGIICNLCKELPVISITDFYETSLLYSTTLSYQKPQFLTLGEIVVKTEELCKHFMIAAHFTKKIFFIASDDLAEGGFLYAADIGKGAQQVVAEKVDYKNNTKLTALTIDQLTGDLILAGHNTYTANKKLFCIYSLQKIPYLPQMIVSAGISTSEENVIAHVKEEAL